MRFARARCRCGIVFIRYVAHEHHRRAKKICPFCEVELSRRRGVAGRIRRRARKVFTEERKIIKKTLAIR